MLLPWGKKNATGRWRKHTYNKLDTVAILAHLTPLAFSGRDRFLSFGDVLSHGCEDGYSRRAILRKR